MGCRNVQVTTAVMQYGYRIIDDLISRLKAYMQRKKIFRLQDLVGAGLKNVTEPDKLDRTTVTYPVFDKKRCIGCGRCCLSCRDGGNPLACAAGVACLKYYDDAKILDNVNASGKVLGEELEALKAKVC